MINPASNMPYRRLHISMKHCVYELNFINIVAFFIEINKNIRKSLFKPLVCVSVIIYFKCAI